MIPRPQQAIADLAIRLAMRVAPNTTDAFSAADAGLIAQLMLTVSQEFERSIDTRMSDIAEMKTLLAVRPRGEGYQDMQPENLTLAAVNVVHDEGMRRVIALHAWAEQHDEALNAEIWQFLRRYSERHKFD